jgi:hypothetical protein
VSTVLTFPRGKTLPDHRGERHQEGLEGTTHTGAGATLTATTMIYMAVTEDTTAEKRVMAIRAIAVETRPHTGVMMMDPGAEITTDTMIPGAEDGGIQGTSRPIMTRQTKAIIVNLTTGVDRAAHTIR